MTERCCDCDLPLATEEDELRTRKLGDAQDLCWRAWHQDRCQMPHMNWQLRAIAAENLLRYVERWLRAGYDRIVRDMEVAQLITEHLAPSHLAKMDGEIGYQHIGNEHRPASSAAIATELERSQDQALKERFRPPASTAKPPGPAPSPRTPAPPSRARRRR